MEIKKNMKFVCIKDVYLNGDGEHLYKKGNIYVSEHDGCITDETGNQGHIWSLDEGEITEFIPYSQLDKVYTKHTPLLEKIFDRYEGKKHEVSHQEIVWYCNCDVNDETGWFWGDGQVSDMEDYYQENGYTYLSEQAFIEFMDLGKYIGSLNVESEEEPDYLKITEEWSKEGEKEEEVFNPQPHYDNSKGSLYKVATERGWSAYTFDVVKRLERGGKKDPLRQEIEKSIDVLKIWLNELEDERK